MKITREDVLYVAELAHLELTDEEVETYRRQLDSILTYMEKLNEVDTSTVEPMAQALYGAAAENPAVREDEPEAQSVAAVVLDRAPEPSKPYFRVPKVIER